MIESKSSHPHGCCMQPKTYEQQKVIDPVVLTKAFAPEENRINHADSIHNHGEQKEVSVSVLICEPAHKYRVIRSPVQASNNPRDGVVICPESWFSLDS